MPRMNMFIQHSNLPRVVVNTSQSLNSQLNQGSVMMGSVFNKPMLNRIAGLKSGCSSCGRK